MKPFRLRILAQTLPFLLIAPGLASAQTPPTRGEATAALNQPANPGAAHYTRQQIDQLVAPIALYPDQLLAQVLMAATYPQQVVEAAQWVQDPSHADVKGDALVEALGPLPWDPSVKALVAFPQILTMMAEHIEWTEALGVAFVTQQREVMAQVQALRHLAMKSGRLNKVRHLKVEEDGPAIVITEAETGKIFVPVYNPTVVYGEWPDREYPPVFIPPPQGFVSETIEPGIEVSIGYTVVAPLWGWSRTDWRENRITVERSQYTRITRNVEIGPGDAWRHAGPVMLVAPTAVARTTVTTTNIPAGTVAPAKAAAVTALPQRAAADPAQIKTQTTSAQPGAGQPNAAQPGKAQSGTSQPERTQTRTSQPSTAQPGQAQTNTAQPSTSQPPPTPQSGSTDPGKANAEPNAAKPSERSARQPEATRLNQEKREARPSEMPAGETREHAKPPAGAQQQTAPQERAGSSAAPSPTEQQRTRAPEHNGAAAPSGQHEPRSRMPEPSGNSTPPAEQHPAGRAPEHAGNPPSSPGAAAPAPAPQRPGPEAGQGSSTPPAAATPHAPPSAQKAPEPAGAHPPGRQEEKDKKEH